MAKLEFKVAADYKEVDKLTNSVNRLENQVRGLKSSDLGLDSWITQFDKFQRELKAKASEIEVLKARILSFDNMQDRKGLDYLGQQLETAKNQYYQLAQEAADGANRFQASFNKASSALLASQKNVDSVTWKLIEQKEVVANLQSEVRRLNEAYRTAGKDEKGAVSVQLTSKKQQLEDERVSLNSLRAEQERAKLAVKSLRDEVASYEKTTRSVTGAQNENEISLKKMLAAFGGAAAIKSFVSDMVRVRGEFQKTQMAFETMLGSKEKADMLMSQMIQTAAKTPFDLQGVADGAKQLLAYGTQAKDVNDTLVRLGNIASGLNIPLGEMVYLYGTTQTQGRLFTQDVRQFMGRGIPLVKEMASLLGKTEEEINKMVTAGQIGFPEVQQVIEKMTNEGGKFYNLMEKQSQTLSGQISNLGDAWDQMLNSIGEETQGVTSATISMATNVVENYEEVGKVLVALIGLYGTYKAATITYYALSKTYGMYDVATKELQFAATMKNVVATQLLTAKQAILNKTMLLNPYALFTAAVIGVVSAMVYLNKETDYAGKAQKRLDKAIKEAEKGALSEQRELAKLKGELSAATKGTDEYNKIRDKIVANYGKYDKNLKEEIDKVGLLDKTYQKLTESIQHSFDVRQYDKFRQEQEAALNDVMSDNLDNIYNKLISKHGEELGSKYYTQIKTALITGAEIPAEANKVISDTYGIWAQSLHHYVKNIREARKATEDADRRARTKFGIKDGKKTNNDEDGKSVLPSVTEEIKDATKKIATLKQELADLRSGKTTVEVGKTVQSVIEEKTKELKATENALATLTGKTTKETDKGLKAQQELSRSIFESELKLQAERIAIMKDGKDKRVLLADQEYKETLSAIEKARAEYQKKVKEAGQTEDPVVMATFDSRESAAKSKRDTDVAAINKEYFDDYAKRTKALTDVFLSEEKKRLSAVRERYEEERKWADEQLKTGGMSEEQYQTYVIHIDKAEAEESLRSLLDKYQDYATERKRIEEQFQAEIETLEKGRTQNNAASVDAAIAEARKKEKEALSIFDLDKLKKEINWEVIFGNLGNLTKKQLQDVKKQLIAFKNSAEFKKNALPEQIKVVEEAVNNINNALVDKSGFWGGLGESLENYKKTVNEVVKAQEDLNAALQEGDKVAIQQAKEKLNTANTHQVTAQVNLEKSKDKAVSNLTAVSNALQQLGEANVSLASFGNAVGGLVDVLSSSGSKIGGLIASILSILDVIGEQGIDKFLGNILTSVAHAVGGILEGVLSPAKWLGIDLSIFKGADYSHYNKMKDQYETLNTIWDELIDKKKEYIKISYGDEADQAGKEAEALVNKSIESYRILGRERLNSGASLGSHSIGVRMKKGMSAEGWNEAKKALGEDFYQYGIGDGRMVGLFDLSVEQLEKLKNEAPTFWAKLDGDVRGYLDNIIAGSEKIEDLQKAVNEQLTQVSFDNVYDSFLSTLMDMDSSAEDFAGDFEGYMQKAILNTMLADKYKEKLQKWYKAFAKSNEDGKIDSDEYKQLKQDWDNMVNDAISDRESLKKMFDWGSEAKEEPSDNTLKGAFAKASQESIDLIAGQFGAMRFDMEAIRAGMQPIREQMQSIYALQTKGWEDVKAIRELTDKVNKNSEQMAANTRLIHEVADRISESTKRAAESLDSIDNRGVKVKI